VQSIKDAAIAHGELIGIGEDVITQRFYGPIYSATSGIGSITVEVAITAAPADVPSYSTTNAALARAEHARFDAVRVSVIGV